MKKTFVILITVALLGILAASVAPGQKSTATTSKPTSTAQASTNVETQSTTAAPAAQAPSTVASTASTGQYKDGQYTGTTASNFYDTIQVAVTISGGKITAVDTPTLQGDSRRSEQINSYAIPQLKDQVITAQSSTIDGVSGASYTSEAYMNSLQSALDQAKA